MFTCGYMHASVIFVRTVPRDTNEADGDICCSVDFSLFAQPLMVVIVMAVVDSTVFLFFSVTLGVVFIPLPYPGRRNSLLLLL